MLKSQEFIFLSMSRVNSRQLKEKCILNPPQQL